LVQLNQAYDKIRKLNAELLAIHVECSEAGTRTTVNRNGIAFPMANDDHLQVVDEYSPTSTYLIDRHGIIRARWLDSIHNRVGPKLSSRLSRSSASTASNYPNHDTHRNRVGTD
jgi:peroxiredoxin